MPNHHAPLNWTRTVPKLPMGQYIRCWVGESRHTLSGLALSNTTWAQAKARDRYIPDCWVAIRFVLNCRTEPAGETQDYASCWVNDKGTFHAVRVSPQRWPLGEGETLSLQSPQTTFCSSPESPRQWPLGIQELRQYWRTWHITVRLYCTQNKGRHHYLGQRELWNIFR